VKSALETFDGLDNRKAVLNLFARIGVGPQADRLRKRCLERLVQLSDNCFAEKMVTIDPLNAVDAYFMFLQITWALEVNIDKAAVELERFAAERSSVITDDRRAFTCSQRRYP
jgi:hypothetical protein